MPKPRNDRFVSRAGEKLAHALNAFHISPVDWTCADLGANTGGFTDCLLQAGAAKVYSVERGYGVLNYRLRKDARVVVMERTDALHVSLPEPVRLVTIDVGWTRQSLILPVARRLTLRPEAPGGAALPADEPGKAQRALIAPACHIISLIKPHYEASPDELTGGVLPDELTEHVVAPLRESLTPLGLKLLAETESPLRGHAGNRELLWHLQVM